MQGELLMWIDPDDGRCERCDVKGSAVVEDVSPIPPNMRLTYESRPPSQAETTRERRGDVVVWLNVEIKRRNRFHQDKILRRFVC